MPQLDSRWTRHLEPDQAEKFRQALVNDTLVLGRLSAILADMEAALDRSDVSESDFDNPNWQYKIAFRNGQRNQLNAVKTLLQFLKD